MNINPGNVQDLSAMEVETKDQIGPHDLMGEEFSPFESENIKIRVFSPDLAGLMVETNVGLAVSLEPAKPGSFFQQSLDDDTSYKLLCSFCLHRIGRGFSQAEFLSCSRCNTVTPYLRATTSTIWMPESGVRLSVEKAEVREKRSNGAFPVGDPAALETYLKTFDFIASLVEWLEPFGNPLECHPRAWDLADMLEEVWVGWKHTRRNRREGKRLSAFRSMEQIFNSEDSQTWTRFPELRSGCAVPVKAPKVKKVVDKAEDPA